MKKKINTSEITEKRDEINKALELKLEDLIIKLMY